jgi:hypothetical protein
MAAADSAGFAEAVKQAAPTALTGAEGWHLFHWSGGSFEVCLRPGGVFYCPQFQAASRWCVKPGTQIIAIAWGKFGNYELNFVAPNQWAGSLVGKPDDWRKMEFKAPLSPAEARLLGAGGAGTEWDLAHAGGEFPIEFRGDGFNHFVCQSFPAHAHWTLGGENRDELTINWAQYGVYEIKVDGPAGQGEGCAKGNPSEWRRMKHHRDLGAGAAVVDCGEHSHL